MTPLKNIFGAVNGLNYKEFYSFLFTNKILEKIQYQQVDML